MYAFIHIPKTAGSTLRHQLRTCFGAGHVDVKLPARKRGGHAWVSAKDLKKTLRVYRNPAGICGHRITPHAGLQDLVPDIRFFTFVRDPIQRTISNFEHSVRSKIGSVDKSDFIDFASDPAQHNILCRWLGGSEDPEDAIRMIDEVVGFVGVQEFFDESMVLFNAWLNNANFDPHYAYKNRSHGKSGLPLLDDPELKDLLYKANAADQVVYQHVIEHVYPAQVEAYGPDLQRDVSAFQGKNQSFQDAGEPFSGSFKRNCVYKPLMKLGIA